MGNYVGASFLQFFSGSKSTIFNSREGARRSLPEHWLAIRSAMNFSLLLLKTKIYLLWFLRPTSYANNTISLI